KRTVASSGAILWTRLAARPAAGRPTPRFRTIQVYPKDLPALPGHPEPTVSWHSGFRGGAHARHKTTPVHHAARRRGRGMAARRASPAGGDAGDRVSRPQIAGGVSGPPARISPGREGDRLRRGRERGDRVPLC